MCDNNLLYAQSERYKNFECTDSTSINDINIQTYSKSDNSAYKSIKFKNIKKTYILYGEIIKTNLNVEDLEKEYIYNKNILIEDAKAELSINKDYLNTISEITKKKVYFIKIINENKYKDELNDFKKDLKEEQDSYLNNLTSLFDDYESISNSKYKSKDKISISISNANACINENKDKKKFNTSKFDYYIVGLKSSWLNMIDYVKLKQKVSFEGLIYDNSFLKNYIEINDYCVTGSFCYLVVEPEIILNPTILKSSFSCIRKSVLSYVFKPKSQSKETIIGTTLHNIFSSLLVNAKNKKNTKSIDFNKLIYEEIDNNKLRYFSYFNNIKEIYDTIICYKDAIFTIVKEFFIEKKEKCTNKLIEYSSNSKTKSSIIYKSKINSYESIEKAYQSEVLGMKGILDLVVSIDIESGGISTNLIVPLEIKTGKHNNDDIYQLATYSLLINNLVESSNYSGYLLYLKSKSLMKIEFKVSDLTKIIQNKNILINYICNLKQTYNAMSDLGPLNKIKEDCKFCFVKTQCYTNYIIKESSLLSSDNVPDNLEGRDNINSYINRIYYNPNLRNYYNKFIDILSKEEAYMNCGDEYKSTLNVNIYSKTNCEYSKNSVNDIRKENNKSNIKYNLNESVVLKRIGKETTEIYVYKYTKYIIQEAQSYDHCNVLYVSEYTNNIDTECKFNTVVIGEKYLIYELSDNILMKGQIITKIIKKNVSLIMISILNKYIPYKKFFIKEYNNNYSCKKLNKNEIYILPLDMDSFNYKFMKSNVVKLLENNVLIDLLVNYKQQNNLEFKIKELKKLFSLYSKDYLKLNNEQKSALIKCIFGYNKYHLIIGLPGTGKTTLLAILIKYICAQNKRILVCAQTHQAVDNLLLKIINCGIEFVRIGNKSERIDNNIKKYLIHNATKNMTVEEINNYLNNNTSKINKDKGVQVFASTIYGIQSNIFDHMHFDYCIIDEACQILEPAILGPILKSDKFVLCGDPNQLSPLIKSNRTEVRHNNEVSNNNNIDYNYSLFDRLLINFPEYSTKLIKQFRMNKDIMLLSNKCIYNGEMICGSSTLKNKQISVSTDDINTLYKNSKYFKNNSWLLSAFQPNKSVLFYDYDIYYKSIQEKSIEDEQNSNNIVLNHSVFRLDVDKLRINIIEVEIIKLIIFNLKILYNDLNNVAVITPFKNQEEYLLKELNTLFSFNNVYTIDKAQGLEKDIIIVSFVLLEPNTHLLRNSQRINVAFTRPRYKLIIVGLFNTLIKIDNLTNYLKIIEEYNWCEKICDIIKYNN